jgi:hypothetical protein
MLDAYGFGDEQDLAPFIAVQDVYVEIWQMYDRQRRRSHEPPQPSDALANAGPTDAPVS